jgi:hypothetical protein
MKPPLSISNLLDRQTETEYLQTFASRFVDFAMYIHGTDTDHFSFMIKVGVRSRSGIALRVTNSFLGLILWFSVPPQTAVTYFVRPVRSTAVVQSLCVGLTERGAAFFVTSP